MINQKTSFSIIIPNYKTKQSYVKTALKSIQNQEYPLEKIEVVLVDDASPRKYQKRLHKMIMHEFGSKLNIRVILTTNKTNAGSKRNQGVNNSKNEYLVFLDSDDSISPNLCMLVDQKLKKKKYNLLYTDQRNISANGKHVLGIKKKKFLHEKMITHFNTLQDPRFHRNFIHHAQIISKKAFLKVGGYYEGLTTAEDADLLLKITNQGLDKVCHIPEVLHNYRITKTGLTRKDKSKNLRDISEILKKHLKLKTFEIKKVKYCDKASFITWFDIYDLKNKKVNVPYEDELIKKEYLNKVNLKNIKLIAIDFDNTLIRPGGEIQESTIEIFKKIKDKGIKICLCSGRGYKAMERITKILGTNDCFIGEIGSTIKLNNNYFLLEEEQSKQIRKALRGIASPKGRKIAVMVHEKDYERADEIIKKNRLNVNFEKNILGKADIVPKGIDKGSGLKYLIKKLGIKKDQVMAIGDFLNDLPMFREAGLSVAVDNAHLDVKEKADIITTHEYNRGVDEILSNLLEIRSSIKS